MRKSLTGLGVSAALLGSGFAVAQIASASTGSPATTPAVTTAVPVHSGNILCARVNTRELTIYYQTCPAGTFWVQISSQDIYQVQPAPTGTPSPTTPVPRTPSGTTTAPPTSPVVTPPPSASTGG